MPLDVAPFAHRWEEEGGRVLLFRWEEPRDLCRIDLSYPDRLAASPGDRVRVEYWQNKWPSSRWTADDLAPGRIGRAGWKPQDDWFNGSWRQAHTTAGWHERCLTLAFNPLGDSEIPEAKDYNVTFRRTLKLRITLDRPRPKPRASIYTATEIVKRKFTVQLGCGLRGRPIPDPKVEVYNGFLDEVRTPSARDPRLYISIIAARPGPFSHDGTIVTVRSSQASFSFRPEDMTPERPIWVPDLRVLVADASANVRYSPKYVRSIVTGRSTYDRIRDMPEQSLASAVKDDPPKRPMHFVVGVEGSRQKFGIEINGDIFAGIGFIRKVPGPETSRIFWEGSRLYLRFDWDDMTPNGRFLEEGYLPMIRSTFSKGALDLVQEVFATKLPGPPDSAPSGDELVVAMARLTFKNRGDESLVVRQFLRIESRPRGIEHLVLEGQSAYVKDGELHLRLMVDTQGRSTMSSKEMGLLYKLSLAPGESHAIVVKMPFAPSGSSDEHDLLARANWDEEHRKVKAFWKRRTAQGTQIHTGIQDLDDFFKAHLTHILINDEHEIGSDRIIGRVSSFNYGNFSNESIMQIMDLDRRGHHEEARRHLETYLHYQGTVGLPGNFQSKEGIFYGSGGYESGGYNQHHGWVLWGLAEHFKYTDDRNWLLGIASKLVDGCDWVVRERRATMALKGRPALEHGYLPAGSLEDVREFCYWFSTNCLTYRGLAAAADALTSVGHPDGPRLTKEAESYRRHILRGVRESTIRSPLVALRDGTYLPHVPSRLYWRGRDIGWIREVLEGSINLVTTVLPADDPLSTWILKDFEDNRYLDSPFNYALDNFEAQWFSRGGFSMQPNLVYTICPYFVRDQIEHFLRVFFNSFAACWRADIRSMTEHPLPTLADWAGDHFKSSDEAMVAFHLRSMFVHESGRELYLGKALPRAWLSPGKSVWIREAETHFGAVSLQIDVDAKARRITAVIDPPTRSRPRRVFLRLRHPWRARIRSVTVNGEAWTKVDHEGELIELPRLRDLTIVRAAYSGRRPVRR